MSENTCRYFSRTTGRSRRKLTLNIGTDYGLEFPITERYNRKMWFDPAAPLPISQQVGLPLVGGFRFADDNTRSPYDLYKKQFGPRVGLAYQLFSAHGDSQRLWHCSGFPRLSPK